MGRRNNLDISADILRAARNGSKKTHVIYRCNLNFKMVKPYFERLIGQGMLTLADGYYTTTRRGLTWLSRYGDLRYDAATPPPDTAVFVIPED